MDGKKKEKNKFKVSFKIVALLVLLLIIVVGVIHIISMLTWDKQIHFVERRIISEKISPELAGLRFALVTDIHDMTQDEVRSLVDKLREKKLDLLLLGGDYGWGRKVIPQMDELGKLDLPLGVYGVDGNHDNVDLLYPLMTEHNVTPLINHGVTIKDGFYLAGVEDLWLGSPNIEQGVAGAKDSDFVLLLTHNPDLVMSQSMAKVDYAVAGHTHGGHATIFGLFAPGIARASRYGHEFLSGEKKTPEGKSIYVSNGAGYYNRVPRVFAPPQVILFTLQSA